MKKIFAFLVLTFFTVSLTALDAEARRMGGGKSFGKQRQSLQQFKQNQQQAPNQGQKSTSPGGGSKWGGALAGLAAGGLLAALFMGGAFEGINMMGYYDVNPDCRCNYVCHTYDAWVTSNIGPADAIFRYRYNNTWAIVSTGWRGVWIS